MTDKKITTLPINNYSSFDKLKVWQAAHELTLAIYQCTKSFPDSERYGLQSQIRRAAVSVPSNIVEGNDRQSKKEYLQSCFTAKASLSEVRYQSLLARDRGYISTKQHGVVLDQIIEVNKLLIGLIKFLKS